MITGAPVLNLARLCQEYYGLTSDREIFLRRELKEAVHELGHTSEMGHCSS